MNRDIFDQKGKVGIKDTINVAAFEIRCPWLGTLRDRATILGFASPSNHCFAQEPPVSVEKDTQEKLCLCSDYANCPIYQAAEEPKSDLIEEGTRKTALRARLRKLRPALLVIPLLLLVIAALIWWPLPGTTVEDNTSRAAPLQKITAPAQETPNPKLQERAPAQEEDGVGSEQEEVTTDPASSAEANTDSSEEIGPIPGYRVLEYD